MVYMYERAAKHTIKAFQKGGESQLVRADAKSMALFFNTSDYCDVDTKHLVMCDQACPVHC
jgi:hypothetical protein